MQTFLTLLSLPILVEWGLAVSLASFLGNCIFAPFISVYLALSFFIFFTELCGLPNFLFILALEKVTYLWVWLTELLGSGGLRYYAVPQAFYFYLLILLSFALIAMQYSLLKKTMLLGILLIFTLFSLFIFAPSRYGIDVLVAHKKPIIIVCLRGVITAIDYGAVSKSASRQDTFLRYTLKPFLVKRYAKEKLDLLIFPVHDKFFNEKSTHIQQLNYAKEIFYTETKAKRVSLLQQKHILEYAADYSSYKKHG